MFPVDCGAYETCSFGGISEKKFLMQEVKRAERSLAEFHLPIVPVIVDFEKITVR